MEAQFNAPSSLMVAACAWTAKILYDVDVNRFVPAVLGVLVIACSSEPQSPPSPPSPQPKGAEVTIPPESRSAGEAATPKPVDKPRREAPPAAEVQVEEERSTPSVEAPEAPDPAPVDASESTSLGRPTALDEREVAAPEKGLGVRIASGTESMKLVSLAVGVAVEARTPVGVADRFETIPPRFHCHSVIDSRAPEGTVIHVWRRGARVISRVELEVGKSPAWRTWSRQRIRPEWADIWSCTVTTLEGVELGVATFEVAPAAALPSGP